MAPPRTGWIEKRKRDGVYFARVEYTDRAGKSHEFRRRGRTGSRREASDILDGLLRDLEQTDNAIAEHERATLSEFLTFYLSTYATEAVYVGDVKVSGVRALPSLKSHVHIPVGCPRSDHLSFDRGLRVTE